MDPYVRMERRMTASSSIYSQDDVTLTDTAPLITISRQNSSSSTTSSQASTLYSVDPVKSLGYTPFEYWKGPLPAAHPSLVRTLTAPSRAPPQIKASTIPRGLVNSRRDFQPVPVVKVREIKMELDAPPAVKVREIKMELHTALPAPTRPAAAAAIPPPSPRVKDRYRPQDAERARQEAERARRQEERARRRAARRAQRARAPHEWPGWVPDEKALGRPRRPRRPRANRFSIASTIILSAPREMWSRPRTWRRRIWGIISLGVMLLVILGIILGQLLSKNNVLSGPQQGQQAAITEIRMLHQAVETVGSSSLTVAAPVRRMVARRFDA